MRSCGFWKHNDFSQQLLAIARRPKLLGGTGADFNAEKRNYRAILIGERLHRLGGIKLMREVWREVDARSDQGRTLEWCWGGVGDWRG